MATDPPSSAATATTAGEIVTAEYKLPRSIYDLTADFFDSCRLLNPSVRLGPLVSVIPAFDPDKRDEAEEKSSKEGVVLDRWTCNTCKIEFVSLQDQRSHFKSDIHRLNIKLSVAGKSILKEEDVDELTSESVQDYDVSSISGSEDEAEARPLFHFDAQKGIDKKKLFFRLQSGEKVSIWKCLIMDEAESVSYGVSVDDCGSLGEIEVTARLRNLIRENTDDRQMRVVLLASGGHFAASVFNGKSVVAHKTFHRYVIRAKAGKKQSTKDASGRSIHSAGASLRRYNELALKKDIQELLASWKPYFDGAACVFIHAPSSSRQLLFNGGKPYFSSQNCAVRNVPFTIRRPTFKESQRIYNQLTQVAYVTEEIFANPPEEAKAKTVVHAHTEDSSGEISRQEEHDETLSTSMILEEPNLIEEDLGDGVAGTSTPLHEAAKSGDGSRVLELLEEGMDPCAKDERGRAPYMLADDKEVRNTFRRFMASNLEKWNWHDAKVPSPLTKEMEESQAAKQAEKDAKKKARAKELKKLRKAREKKAQAEAEKEKPISKVEEVRRAMAAEREKRAAAAERRMAALNTQSSSTT
ncbi:unnamed protein product [Microthlaspi erraticum]|uniref:VLRF1 domain-containing protein n=1 Tax=Microthlaspi erraticum TaxID=1685480 RepID=A0A6D2ILV6_9BRAS|nr:unnamed protein product [Microthlaspi erraticum]